MRASERELPVGSVHATRVAQGTACDAVEGSIVVSDVIKVTVDGEPVTREITLERVRAYLAGKGWIKGIETDKDDFGNPLRCRVEVWDHGCASVLIWLDGKGSGRRMIEDIAGREGRPPAEVLREIAGGDEQPTREVVRTYPIGAPGAEGFASLHADMGNIVVERDGDSRAVVRAEIAPSGNAFELAEAIVALARGVKTTVEVRADEIETGEARGHRVLQIVTRASEALGDMQDEEGAAWLLVAQRLLAREAGR